MNKDDFEKSLQALVPTQSNRDHLLFLMGQASAQSRRRWVWPSWTLFFAAMALGLGITLAFEVTAAPKIIYTERVIHVVSPLPPLPEKSPQEEALPPRNYPWPEVKNQPKSVDPLVLRSTQIYREVLTFGINALPETRSDTYQSIDSHKQRQELSKWLGISPEDLDVLKRY